MHIYKAWLGALSSVTSTSLLVFMNEASKRGTLQTPIASPSSLPFLDVCMRDIGWWLVHYSVIVLQHGSPVTYLPPPPNPLRKYRPSINIDATPKLSRIIEWTAAWCSVLSTSNRSNNTSPLSPILRIKEAKNQWGPSYKLHDCSPQKEESGCWFTVSHLSENACMYLSRTVVLCALVLIRCIKLLVWKLSNLSLLNIEEIAP